MKVYHYPETGLVTVSGTLVLDGKEHRRVSANLTKSEYASLVSFKGTAEFDSKALAIGLAKIIAKIRKKTQQPDAAEIAGIGKRSRASPEQIYLPRPIKRSPSDLPRPEGRKEAKQKKGVSTSQNILHASNGDSALAWRRLGSIAIRAFMMVALLGRT